MYRRNIVHTLLEAIADTPVVLVNGARQTGKTTLVQELASSGRHAASYLTFDDAGVLSAAAADPAGFLAGLAGSVVLDEVQKVPALFPEIKRAVDRDRRPGRFLLTGSADVLLLPRLSESLAGRMEIATLWPLSQGEIEGMRDGFIDAAFGASLPARIPAPARAEVVRRLLRGGYPEVVRRGREERRAAWFSSTITAVLERDVRDLANIEGLTALPRLLSLLAARAGGLLNHAELARSTGMPLTTLRRYMALLETTFLVRLVPAWSGSLGARLIKSPKLYLNDTGLLAHLVGLGPERLSTDPGLLGPLLENFVVMELTKQVGWSRTRAQLFHFRTLPGREVDVVLEDRAGRLVGIEVKAGATVGTGDFQGLRALADMAGKRFHRGVLLHLGDSSVPFGPRLHALPVGALWST